MVELSPQMLARVEITTAAGDLFVLVLRGYPFSISASVGFTALVGAATMNGLVLVSHVEKLRRQGLELGQALRRGAAEKTRAMILVTSTLLTLLVLPTIYSWFAPKQVDETPSLGPRTERA